MTGENPEVEVEEAEDQTTSDEQTEAEATEQDASGGEESQGSGDGEESYLTLAQVQEILTQAFQQYDQQNRRSQQSQLDKREARLQKWLRQQSRQIESLVDVAKQAGGLDDAQTKTLRSSLKQQLVDAALERSHPKRKAFDFEDDEDDEELEQPQYQSYDRDAVMQQATEIWDYYELDRDDPEIALINTHGSPDEYLKTIDYAGRLRKMRLASAPKTQKQPKKPESDEDGPDKSSVRSPAVTPGGKKATSNPIAKITDPEDLYKLGTKGIVGD